MCTCVKNLLVFVIFAFTSAVVYGQQVTKEQLLKLFYQAHVAQNENNQQGAIDAYIEILKLSPGLPDPYLQLGNIYADMSEDVAAMKKACICYANYLKLKPEASEAESLKNKISHLTLRMRELEKKNLVGELPVPVKEVELPENKKISVVLDERKEEDIKATAQVPQDSVPVMKPLPASPVDEKLLGRWASSVLAENGREMWIFDILSINDELWMQFNDSSYMKKEPLLAGLRNWKAKGMADGDELVFTLKIEERKDQQAKKKSVLGGFGTIVSEMFDVDWDSFVNPTSAAGDTIPVEKPDTLSTAADSSFVEPLIVHTYQFRLKPDEGRLAGTLQTCVVDLMLNSKVLRDEKQDLELFNLYNSLI